MKGIQVFAAAGGNAEVLIYEHIGPSLFEEGITAKTFAEQLKALGSVRTINVRINSPGGSVFEGLAIYNILKSHKAKKVVHIDGAALSIASIIAMAGDQILIAANAMIMIHDPASVLEGGAEDMRRLANLLDTVRNNLADIYAGRTRQPRPSILSMMNAETWLDAKEAKQFGFADTIVGEMAIAAAFDKSLCRRVPDRFNRDPFPATSCYFNELNKLRREGLSAAGAAAKVRRERGTLVSQMRQEARGAAPNQYNAHVRALQRAI